MQHLEYKKLFIFGYYNTDIYKGAYFNNMTPFNNDIELFSLNEILSLNFAKDFNKWFYDNFNVNFETISFEKKVKAIIKYSSLNKELGLLYIDNENQATDYKNKVLKELNEIKNVSTFVGTLENSNGEIVNIYELKPCFER